MTKRGAFRYFVGHDTLQKHMVSTYFCLRLGMTAIALASPALIVGWGMYWGAHWERSLSAYYFSPGDGTVWNYSNYPGRVPFVGILFALGFALWAYKGYTRWENAFLNAAGLSAILVAVFPMYPEKGYISVSATVHFASAACLFFCMSVVAIFFGKDSLSEIPDRKVRRSYLVLYRGLGVLMFLFPVIGYLFAVFLHSVEHWLLFIEVAGILIFAAFWGVKTFELRSMEVDIKALKGQLPAQQAEAPAAAAQAPSLDFAPPPSA